MEEKVSRIHIRDFIRTASATTGTLINTTIVSIYKLISVRVILGLSIDTILEPVFGLAFTQMFILITILMCTSYDISTTSSLLSHYPSLVPSSLAVLLSFLIYPRAKLVSRICTVDSLFPWTFIPNLFRDHQGWNGSDFGRG